MWKEAWSNTFASCPSHVMNIYLLQTIVCFGASSTRLYIKRCEVTTIGTHKIFEPSTQPEPLIQLAAWPPIKASAVVAAHVGEESWQRSRPYDDGGITGVARRMVTPRACYCGRHVANSSSHPTTIRAVPARALWRPNSAWWGHCAAGPVWPWLVTLCERVIVAAALLIQPVLTWSLCLRTGGYVVQLLLCCW
jgi:hypothetical protein